MRILLLDPANSLPDGIGDLIAQQGWSVHCSSNYAAAAAEVVRGLWDGVVVADPDSSIPGDSESKTRSAGFQHLLRVLEANRVGGILVTPEGNSQAIGGGSLVSAAPRSIGKEEILGRLNAMSGYQTLVQRMERELDSMQRLGKRLNQHFSEVDQEMRLAGRLQRDFLPKKVDFIDGVRFAALYRPASWVSGDIYDVFRVDEKHVGFYVADAVGHGMAASLLTMFIKRSMVPKRIEGDRYEVLEPSETLQLLNDSLTSQDLPNCQFVTACYALLNIETLELRYARGGHPYPCLISENGYCGELKSEGGLMGLFKGEEFPTRSVQLKKGDKLIVYTDGIEHLFGPHRRGGPDSSTLVEGLQTAAMGSISDFLGRLDQLLDEEDGSLHPRDDITVLTCEITG
ncbi:MAG: SpoIIE family protein phosphatase [Planctomycetes bacterium]|nr:SpoIIE family protein phosphatase [Planctomycetota bacterium]